MKKLLAALGFMLVLLSADAQYQLYKEVEGVEFYTKWGREKWLSKKSPKVLLIKVVNKGSLAVDFEMGVEFFKDMIMVEESKPSSMCISAGKTLLPRMAGLVYKPAEVNPEEIDGFELSDLEVTKRTLGDCTAH